MYNDYYNSSAMSGFLTAYGIFMIALLIVAIVAMWRIFTKAGEAGWKCLIPIYSSYKLYDIGWEGSYFWAPFVVSFIGGLIGMLLMRMGQAGAVISGLISLGCGIFALVISCKMAIRLAHRFGKSTAFGVIGLWLFSLIGYLIIGLGSADYRRERDYGDGIQRSDYEIEKDAADKPHYL